jgi:hypothetical protein
MLCGVSWTRLHGKSLNGTGCAGWAPVSFITIHLTNILHAQVQPAAPILPNSPVNPNKIWNFLIYPPQLKYPSSPPPDYHTNLPPKFPHQYSYYIDGSFKPTKEKSNNNWKQEKAGYRIYNLHKNITLSTSFQDSKTFFELSSLLYTTPYK